jgi:hypothetical protein
VVGSGGSVNRFWRTGRSGFAGFGRYNNKQIKNHPTSQQQTSPQPKTHHNKKSTKHNKKKSANTPILDRIGEGEADAVAESVRSGPNPTRSHQIRRDLARFGEISPDPVRSHQIWNLYVAVRGLEVQIGR